MAVLRTDIERGLDELASQEEGMRFQGLAVVLGKMRWPELIARQRKKDFGLDAYAPSGLTPERIGKGLAASITPTLKKVHADAKIAKENFSDLEMLLFVTSAKVGNADRKLWEEVIQKDFAIALHIIEREEIITQLLMPENASLRATFLHLELDAEPTVAALIDRTRRAAETVARTWAERTKGHPLIDLTAVQVDPKGAESANLLSLVQIDEALSQSRRIVLEGPAGCGKTTTLIQVAQRARAAGTTFMVELPAWTSSGRGILEYIAGMPAFQAEGLTAADLSRVQQAEPFLLLLNGWNEIAESSSDRAHHALRELERDFPSAGIMVATRTHHLTPPLPGALRLRLMGLRRVQRTAYLAARLGAKGDELRTRLDADPSLDDLTRTPFILSEVASLFEAGAAIPSTKLGVLAEVLRLQEQRDEHRNALQAVPLFGRHSEFLKALATEMTRRGAVVLPEADARAVAGGVARELALRGQIGPVGPPAVLGTLTAHHVLERVEYPSTGFQFEHQQLQEHYAALDVRALLLELRDDDRDSTGRFTSEYVNEPAWAEPLRMIAETLAAQTGDRGNDERHAQVGAKLVEMALAVDLVFAGELAQMCGEAVWDKVRGVVGERLRAVYAMPGGYYKPYALAAVLATGADDFRDIILPLLSGRDQQTRLRTYQLWPDIQLSSLGTPWRDEVGGWSEEARADFVAVLLHHRGDREVAAFAASDNSLAVKKAAIAGLIWTGSDDALTAVLESLDPMAFEDVARENANRLPAAFKRKAIAAMRRVIESMPDHAAQLLTALNLLMLGETGLDSVVKNSMAALRSSDLRKLSSHNIKPALEYLGNIDPAWASEWVATQVAQGVLYEHEYWLPFATAIPDGLVQKYLQRCETEDLKHVRYEGMVAVIAAGSNANHAARVFAKLRDLRRKVDAEPDVRHELEWQVMRQLGDVFRRLPGEVATAGVLKSVTRGDPLDIRVAAHLLSRAARSEVEPLRVADEDLKGRLRAYLKSGVDVVLRQDDFNGEEKANLASSIAQVGRPEDMDDLMRLIRADIERMRRARTARAAGERSRLGNGGSTSYARWNIAAIMHLDSDGAAQPLIDLLQDAEYLSDASAAMAYDFVPKSEHPFDPAGRYSTIWAAREGRIPPPRDDHRRTQFADALNARIKLMREQKAQGEPTIGLNELANALAGIDGRGSAAAVLEAIAMPGRWDQYIRLDSACRLLMAGVVLPTTAAFTLVDSVLERTEKGTQDSDRHLLSRILALCPFVDDPAAGIAKMRDVLGKRRLWGYELRESVIALGESRVDAAFDLLYDLASDANTFEQCEDDLIDAFAALDSPRARELLVSFVDPNSSRIALKPRPRREEVLVARLTEQARRRPEAAARLLKLCELDLPEPNRSVLSQVMHTLGSPDALAANLNLIDDARPSPVPRGVWDQLENAFVERRPYGQSPNVFTEHARASNGLRVRLFRMASEDGKRRKSAFMLLGQLEEWRLEHGRPTGEPRHPDYATGQSWPPKEP